ncbi:MAG: aldo/keto reductase [Methanosphaera sp.]|nr:aldo/keto reductase [Methanosphaera sp.]
MLKKLGFGLMRLPVLNDKIELIDVDKVKEMIDYYMSKGFNYFDTAHVYHKGSSELIVKEVLTERYPRESFILTSKLPIFNLEKEEDMEEIFNEQLEKCGVDYFDYYLLHNVSSKHKDKFTRIDSFKFINEKKEEGKIKHIGISCHDSPEFLEEILVNHPEIEVVQLQINYLDWNDNVINAKECYNVACKYAKKVIIMEGLKGGSLLNLPSEAQKMLNDYDTSNSPLEWCFRFNYSLDNILVVLSGMNSLEEVKENIAIHDSFKKLSHEDYDLLEKVVIKICDNKNINCTSCNYCTDYCPKGIRIPQFFELYNSQHLLDNNHSLGMYYRNLVSANNIYASDCIECNSCVDYCPQHINIPEMLKIVAKFYE